MPITGLTKLLKFGDIPAQGNPVGLMHLPSIITRGDRGLTFGRSQDGGIPVGKIPGYWTCPYDGTITGAYLSCDRGGFTVRIWKASRPFTPIQNDNISINGLRLRAPKTHVEIFNVSDFREIGVVAGDTFAVEIKAVFAPKPTDISGSVVILPIKDTVVTTPVTKSPVIKPPRFKPPIPFQFTRLVPSVDIIPPADFFPPGPGVWSQLASGPAKVFMRPGVSSESQSVDLRKGFVGQQDFAQAGTLVAFGIENDVIEAFGTGPIITGDPLAIRQSTREWKLRSQGPWAMFVEELSLTSQVPKTTYPSASGLWVPVERQRNNEHIRIVGSGPITAQGISTILPWRIFADGPWTLFTH